MKVKIDPRLNVCPSESFMGYSVSDAGQEKKASDYKWEEEHVET